MISYICNTFYIELKKFIILKFRTVQVLNVCSYVLLRKSNIENIHGLIDVYIYI